MVHVARGTATRTNPYLLIAGSGAMVVATVGLFVRASPTLSGFFLVVGAALLVIAVFAPENRRQSAPADTDVELTSIESDDHDVRALGVHQSGH